jgi:hypothetical protein
MSDQPRGQPRKPQHSTPHEGGSPGANPEGTTPNGVPEGTRDEEPTAYPNSDRHHTESAPTHDK